MLIHVGLDCQQSIECLSVEQTLVADNVSQGGNFFQERGQTQGLISQTLAPDPECFSHY